MTPVAPVGPRKPDDPVFPVLPGDPGPPGGPVTPVLPGNPVLPIGPTAPVDPCAPLKRQIERLKPKDAISSALETLFLLLSFSSVYALSRILVAFFISAKKPFFAT